MRGSSALMRSTTGRIRLISRSFLVPTTFFIQLNIVKLQLHAPAAQAPPLFTKYTILPTSETL
jgi:hypothetical protein